MSHTVKLECPQCGSSDWYRYPHRYWIKGYKRQKSGDQSARTVAASPLKIVKCRGCGIAYSCSPSAGRQKAEYLLPVDLDAIERMKTDKE